MNPVSKLEHQLLRTHFFNVHLNAEELDILNAKRGAHRKGEWLRMASLHKLPPAIPAINLQAWHTLSDISRKLNRLINHFDTKSSHGELTKTEIFAVKKQINELRSCLTVSTPSVRFFLRMKGMQRIKRGKCFAGVVFYALKQGLHHRSAPAVIGGNMPGDSAAELITEFDGCKHLRPDVQKPVWHNSLRLPAGESLTAEQWSCFADDYMRHMGFSDTHLRCYVLHDDSSGQHIHIIASRIDMVGGSLYLGSNENLISTPIISELEIVHGLTVTKTAPSLSNTQPKRKGICK